MCYCLITRWARLKVFKCQMWWENEEKMPPLWGWCRPKCWSQTSTLPHGHATCSHQWQVGRSDMCRLPAEALRASVGSTVLAFPQPRWPALTQREAAASCWLPPWGESGAGWARHMDRKHRGRTSLCHLNLWDLGAVCHRQSPALHA